MFQTTNQTIFHGSINYFYGRFQVRKLSIYQTQHPLVGEICGQTVESSAPSPTKIGGIVIPVLELK